MRTTLLTFLFCAATALTAYPASLVRGPYLQMTTQTGTSIRWRTDQPASSAVRYGTSPEALTEIATVDGAHKDHRVRIEGLKPGERYYYAIGNDGAVLAEGDGHYVETIPPDGFDGPTRVWVLGDCGTGNANAAAVRDAFTNFPDSERTDLVLLLGDNAYPSGTDEEYQRGIFNIYDPLLRRLNFWSTRGNHEMHGNVYYDIFEMPTRGEAGGAPSLTEAYYSFDYANIHFVCLDSYMTSRDREGAMLTWLRTDLNTTDQEWIVCFFHHPPYSKGSHDTDDLFDSAGRLFEVRTNAVPILEDYGVDLVLSGHSHSYERSFLMKGHYGISATFDKNLHVVQGGSGRPDDTGAYRDAGSGTVYLVGGSSGKISGGPLNHPAMYYSENGLGSVILDIEKNRLKATFLRENGNVPDWFVIERDP